VMCWQFSGAPIEPPSQVEQVVSRLRRAIEPRLVVRACALWPAGELTRLEALVTPVAPCEPLAEVLEAGLRFDHDLLRPAATQLG
jgi:hypothetical protein